MLDKKEIKKFLDILIKLSHVYHDLYITKTLYVVSSDIYSSFIVKIDDTYIDMFNDIYGDFRVIKISDIKKYKTDFKNNYENTDDTELFKSEFCEVMTNPKKEFEVFKKMDSFISRIPNEYNFKPFVTDDTIDDIVEVLFTKGSYIEYEFDNGDYIILSKVLFPMTTAKNINKLLYYNTAIKDDLKLAIFYQDFDILKLYNFNFFIDINTKKEE